MPDVADMTVSGVTGAAPDEPALDLGYTVSVDAFSGPLDLLLFLVRKSELDIIEIPVATITDQFVALISLWQQQGELDLEVAGDFILMAASLLEIKARTIAPPPIEEGEQSAEDEDDVLDPRTDLIGKLLAYRRFKEAVGLLNQLEAERALRILRQTREEIPEDPEEAAGIDLGELDVTQLSKLWNTLLIRIGGGGPRTVMKDEMPIEGSIRKLTARAEDEKNLTLRQLFAAEATLQGRISMLMATLECTRQRIVFSQQHEQYADVELRFRDEAERVITPVVFPPDEPGKKRRRRPPLVTYQAAVPPTADDLEEASEQPEEKHETDEERFLRELNESCDLDGVLARVVDVEKGFQAYWDELHPPAVPVIVEAKASVETEPKPPELEKSEPEKITAQLSVVEQAVVEQPVVEQPVAELPVVEQVMAVAVVEPSVVAEAVVTIEPSAVSEIPVAVEQALVEQAPVEPLAVVQFEEVIATVASAPEPVAVAEELPKDSSVTETPSLEELHVVASIPEEVNQPAAELIVAPSVIELPPLETSLIQESHVEPPNDSVAFADTHEPMIHVDAELVAEVMPVAELRTEELIEKAVPVLAPQAIAPQVMIEAIAPAINDLAECQHEIPALAPEMVEVCNDIEPETIHPEPIAIIAEPPLVISAVEMVEPQQVELAEVELAEVEPAKVELHKDIIEVPAILVAVIQPAPVPVAVPVPVTEHVIEPVLAPVAYSQVFQATKPVAFGNPRHGMSRTLWVLLAGAAGGTLAGWWVMAQAEPTLSLSLSTWAMSPSTGPMSPPTLVSVPLLPITPSTPILVIPSVPPSAALLRVAEGPPEIWLPINSEAEPASPWPIVVPWTACLPHPVTPSSIEAFAESPIFTGLPGAAWVQDQAWAWCAGGMWSAPVVPRYAAVVPELAFVLPLTVPATVDGWLIEPDLRMVPASTFAEPLGWTVFARPSLPAPTSFIVSVPSLLAVEDDTPWQPSEEFLEFLFEEPFASPTESIP